MPRIYVGPTSREHQTAMARIGASFEFSKDRMNGRDLRMVVNAYLQARGRDDLPFRTRTRTEHRHGIQEHSLVLELPDVSELHDWERRLTGDLSADFIEDLTALLSSWFDRHQHRLVVSETTRMRGWSTKGLVRYRDCRVDVDPWFFERH